jgi:pectin lyase
MGTTLTASTIFFHAVNNYFQNIGGHAFDIDKNTYVLMEGNYFDTVTTPMTPGTTTAGGAIYDVITVAEAGACTSYTGYLCEWNKAYSSGTLYDIANVAVLSKASQYKSYLVGHTAVADVPANVKANAGIGKI